MAEEVGELQVVQVVKVVGVPVAAPVVGPGDVAAVVGEMVEV